MGTLATDLAPLANLTKLEMLNLRGAKLTDLTPLAHLQKLETLSLDGAIVTDEQVERLRQALPNCKISR